MTKQARQHIPTIALPDPGTCSYGKPASWEHLH